MKRNICIGIMMGCLVSGTALATSINNNDTITAIYGSDNPNSGWVSSTTDGSVLGLIADNRSTGYVPNNGDGSFTFPTGLDPNNSARALWNFAFSVNNSAGITANSYFLSIQGPGISTVFNLAAIGDNAYGTSSTPNGGGTVGAFGSVSGATVMQNSENILFFGGDAMATGDYTFVLSETPLTQSLTVPPDSVVNSVGMVVHVDSVPDGGSTLALTASALGGLVLIKRRLTPRPISLVA